MEFNAIVGNPPYQLEIKGSSAKPIYNRFIDICCRLSDRVCLITPARFLVGAGKTPKGWSKQILNNYNINVCMYEKVSNVVFRGTDIKGGVVVLYYDKHMNFGRLGDFTPYKEIRTVLDKVNIKGENKLSDIVFSPEEYKFSEKLHKDFPTAKLYLSKGHLYTITTNIFKKLDFIFDENKTKDKCIKVVGIKDRKRLDMFIHKDYIEKTPNIYKYKIFLNKANGSGKLGERLREPILGKPYEVHTQSFISIGAFNTKEESISVMNYVKTKFVRVLLGTLKVTQQNKKSVWNNVPIQDFTNNSDINWKVSIEEIDKQLFDKYKLTKEEREYIDKVIKPMKGD